VSKTVVVSTLQDAGIKAIPTRKGFSIADAGGEPVHIEFTNRHDVILESMRLRSTDVSKALDIAVALVPLFGPIKVDDTIIVDGSVGIDELRRQLQQRVFRSLAHVLEAMNSVASHKK
jgi:hypothetical protein